MAITASDQLVEKWVELLRDVTPALKRVALLYDPRPAPTIERVARDASVAIGIEIIPFQVTDAEGLGAALAGIETARPDGLLISNDALLLSARSRLVAFARDRMLPAVYGQREYVDAGGLMSYSTSIYDVWRRAGSVVNKLLKGGKASEIPIELPAKFELVINLKTAKALGLDVPVHLQHDRPKWWGYDLGISHQCHQSEIKAKVDQQARPIVPRSPPAYRALSNT
jgi:putative ABC transport system substrate-binding protein